MEGFAKDRCSRRAWLAGVAAVGLSACGEFPRDSSGALSRIRRQRRVRVGAVAHPPWVRLGAEPTGLEPDLIRAWATRLGAIVTWRVGPLDPLAEALHAREIDVLVAGFEEKTPYAPRLALTQPYLQVLTGGQTTKRVLAVTQGENALLLSLDRFLLAQDEPALRRALGPVA